MKKLKMLKTVLKKINDQKLYNLTWIDFLKCHKNNIVIVLCNIFKNNERIFKLNFSLKEKKYGPPIEKICKIDMESRFKKPKKT